MNKRQEDTEQSKPFIEAAKNAEADETEEGAERAFKKIAKKPAERSFDRWERVWHEGQISLVTNCVAPVYVRHDESGTRRVTPEEYAPEIATAQWERPNTRFIVYDHELTKDRAWFRFTLMWNDKSTGEKRTRAGMQVYRIEGGKLAETWLSLQSLGSAWPDVARQERWTSKRAIDK